MKVLALTGSGILMLLCVLLPSAAPAQEGLIRKADITYLGAFRLPLEEVPGSGEFGGSIFNYGGHGLAPYRDPASGKHTLFIEGHAGYPGYVAQVEVPAGLVMSSTWEDLPPAAVLQNFHDVTDGNLDTLVDDPLLFDPMSFIYGMMPYNGRLIVAAAEYYDGDYSQVNSHGASGLDLSAAGDFQGFYPLAGVANARSKGGYMTTAPYNWKTPLGGPALTGNCCLPIISAGSAGPAATVFDPDQVGAGSPVPGTTLLFYPLDQPLAPVEGQNEYFNLATHVRGIAFPQGSRSVLFVGRQGTGPYCYGCGIMAGDPCPADPLECNSECCVDPCDPSKGTHAYPYRHQVWAYDAGDLLPVRSGASQTWEPQPYAIWSLDDMDAGGCADMEGAGYDPLTRRLYITQAYEDFPRVDVYQVGYPTDISAPARIEEPTPRYFNTLSGAYDGLTGSGTIRARDYYFDEDLTCDSSYAVTLDGGYDTTYATPTGRTATRGKVTVSAGSLTVSRLDIW